MRLKSGKVRHAVGSTLVSLVNSVPKFRAAMLAQGKSPNSISTWCGKGTPSNRTGKVAPYSGYVGKLVKIAGDDTWVRDLRPEHMDALFTSYKSAGSHNQCYVAISAYLRWAETNEYISATRHTQLMNGRKTLPFSRGDMYYLSIEEYDKGLEIAGAHHPQRRAIVALAFNTLLRQSEITAIKLGRLRREDHILTVYRSKKKKDFEVSINPSLDRELFERWLPAYAAEAGYASWEDMADEHPEWPLIPRLHHHGKRTGIMPGVGIKGGLEDVAKEVLRGLKVDRRRHGGQGMHMFRRSAARVLFNVWSEVEGGNRAILRVSLMCGHADIKTTMNYIGYEPERQALHHEISNADPFDAARNAAPAAVAANVVSLADRRAKKAIAN